ncbi:protein AF-9 isoform X2 [Amyelois transitella]|nr:protein AF-9 isoform X2 [Amyelois transitella]
MSAIKVIFEIGHVASLRSKKTPEGFTHDWEVFVRGQEGSEISHFVDKVVFNLHSTFHKPRRVVKEPPFSLKESGYAGFVIPIEIHLKNKDEPKKIPFMYDLTLHNSGLLKDRYVFQNPNDEFKKKLLKGGGMIVPNNSYYSNPDQESRSRDSFSDDKPQMVSKPKMSLENVKKHKIKEHKEEVPHKTSSFETLFGPPIQKPPKVSPDPKKVDKNTAKPEKKERTNSDKKSKHDYKEVKPDKAKVKEDKEKTRSEKIKTHSKEQERTKEKSNKRSSDRPLSPELVKKRCISPVRKPPSPPPRSSSASSFKDEYKPSKHDGIDQKKQKTEDKAPEMKTDKESKEKKKKEKKSHDRDKERKEKREHKKESHKPKESPKEVVKEVPKIREVPKEVPKESPPVKEKQTKLDKSKFSIENLRKTPPPENVDRLENHKSKDKGDSEKRHKHKKKDKKRDESREKHKESSKEKKHKHEKREVVPEPVEVIERRETPVSKERSLPEPASPNSIDTASQCSSKSGLAKTSHVGNEDINSSHSDSESSIVAEEEDTKVKVENPSPELLKHEPSPELEPEPDPEPEPEAEPEPEPVVEPPQPQKEKSRKHKDKSSKREEKRRKRKAAEEEEESRKIAHIDNAGPLNTDAERGESSGSALMETKVQDNGVSSSLGEDAEPGDLSPEYMVQLRDLQKRIMTINNNEELERVVNLIAETGRYEVTTQTFDFDLCLLDRSTVQQLIQLVGC